MNSKKDKYILDIDEMPRSCCVINIHRYIGNRYSSSEGITAFMDEITRLDGAMVINDEDIDGLKTYIKDLAEDINGKYCDCSLRLRYHDNWYGENCCGFYVYSAHCYCPVCDIYFIGVQNTVHILNHIKENTDNESMRL